MNIKDIIYYHKVNETNSDIVEELRESIINNGWQGPSILIYEDNGCLVTGSHRIEALKSLAELEEYEDFEIPTIDVSEYIHQYYEENGEWADIDYSCLTWLRNYATEEEWEDMIQNCEC